jgi:3-oxosteroid 1-dehydrogenase
MSASSPASSLPDSPVFQIERNRYCVDVLVVGSGAGGMAGAITAQREGLTTLCIEKADRYGGSTAYSGGVIWIPDNDKMASAGVKDSEEDAFTYLDQLVSQDVPREKIRTYVQKAKEMLRYFEQHTLLEYEPASVYPDYYAHIPGAKSGARSMDPVPFTRRKLGKVLSDEMIRPFRDEENTFYMTANEAHQFFSFTPLSPLVIVRTMLRYWLDIPFRLKGESDNRLTLGKALVGRLRKSMELVGAPLWLSAPLKDLDVAEDGLWLATVEREGKAVEVEAKNVIFASGGFEKNQELREKYLPQPTCSDWSAANPNNTGDSLPIAEKLGAQIAMLDYVWWTPTYILPDGKVEALIVNKSMPGCVIVNAAGQRFCNEAEPYEDFVKHQYQAHKDDIPSIPAYFVFDARYRKEYPIGSMMEPAKYVKDAKHQHLFDKGWIKKADTLEALAQLCGIDQQGLLETTNKMAMFAESGKDADFGKGDAPIDRYYSDHRLPRNPCLAALSDAPFYAIEIWPGDLGTKGGLVTNENAQMLNQDGDPIKGLYATGNASAALMGDSYPGAGATIGPALTFAYIAAQHIAKS